MPHRTLSMKCPKPKCCEHWTDEQVDAAAAVVIILTLVATAWFWVASLPS